MKKIMEKGNKILGTWRATLVLAAALAALAGLRAGAEPKLGVYRAFDVYLRSPFLYADVLGFKLPMLPGGSLLAAILLVNLGLLCSKLGALRKNHGLWAVHAGLSLALASGLVDAAIRHETMMVAEPGQTLDYAEDARHVELALIDETDSTSDRVFAINEAVLRRGGTVGKPSLPLEIRVHQYLDHHQHDQIDDARADVEASEGPLSKSGGRWNLSMRGEPVRFPAGGRRYSLELRRRRRYLPVSLTLDQVRPELDPAGDAVRGLASRVKLSSGGATREAEISTKAPLREAGMLFYQAGISPDARLSILEVADDRARPLRLLSCLLVAGGLLLHFGRRFVRA